MQISAATLARKQTNFKLAKDLLIHQIKLLSTPVDDESPAVNCGDLLPSLTSLLKCRDSLELLDVMRVERESAKLLNALSQPRLAMEVLSNSVASCLTFSEKPAENGMIKRTKQACGELCSRSLMTLTKWLQADGKLVGSVGGDGMRLASQPQGQAESVVATIRLLLDCEAKGVAQQQGNLLQNFTGESFMNRTECHLTWLQLLCREPCREFTRIGLTVHIHML